MERLASYESNNLQIHLLSKYRLLEIQPALNGSRPEVLLNRIKRRSLRDVNSYQLSISEAFRATAKVFKLARQLVKSRFIKQRNPHKRIA